MPTVSPVSRRASSAEKVIVCTARSTSAWAVVSGLPASSAIVRANSSRRSRSRAATPSRIAARRCAGRGVCIACSAASIALRASSPPPYATRPTTLPSNGDVTSRASPVSYHSPPTYSFWTVSVAAMSNPLSDLHQVGQIHRELPVLAVVDRDLHHRRHVQLERPLDRRRDLVGRR